HAAYLKGALDEGQGGSRRRRYHAVGFVKGANRVQARSFAKTAKFEPVPALQVAYLKGVLDEGQGSGLRPNSTQ
ncbi:MAG: hypothetical protein LAQ30_07130, partial [Acidobacteriia bacterium]|nr:hypothetical protein [Terriglobia bacterium]